MKLLILILLVFISALLVSGFFKKSKRKNMDQKAWPYYVKRPMGAAEQVLYFRLQNALPDHIILAQVHASRILNVKPDYDFDEWQTRLQHLSFDFIVCEKNFNVVAAIELDDASHKHVSQQEMDAKKNMICKDAGLRLIRWHVKLLPDEASIEAAFSEPTITKNNPPNHAYDEQFDLLLASDA